MTDTTTADLQITLRGVGTALHLGHIELDSEATLNSLTLGMVRGIADALELWRDDRSVVGVVITGAGDRAFCAGGDIQALYAAVTANHAAGELVDPYAHTFFAEEYRLDHSLHIYPKPVITLGHGIVMGGGMGLLSGSRYRVLTNRSRLALPEVTIGLFPDAGATWTLRNTPVHWASFVGLTGCHLNAADAMLAGWGTHVIDHDQRAAHLDYLLALPWQADAAQDAALLDEFYAGLQMASPPEGQLQVVPEQVVQMEDFAAEIARTRSLRGLSEWVDRGIAGMEAGCATTAGIVLEQLRRGPAMSLAETYQMELVIGTHCAENPEFAEGVRALLIDKDLQPRWLYTLDSLDWDYVLSHFVAPWEEHPLADLSG
ncbi:MAG: enoyl-CoA hydratase/isomerase family protein [Pseudomonadota bacterium]